MGSSGLLKMMALALATAVLTSLSAVYAMGPDTSYVSMPTTSASLADWGLDNSGNVDTVKVAWTPVGEGDYTIHVILLSGQGVVLATGSSTVHASGLAYRTDLVDIQGKGVDPSVLASVNIAIMEQ